MSALDYRAPTTDQADTMRTLTAGLNSVLRFVESDIAPSAERTLAIRKLQEFRMWANVAILGIGLD